MRVAWTELMTEEYCTTLADSMDAPTEATEATWCSLATNYEQLATIIAVLDKQRLVK